MTKKGFNASGGFRLFLLTVPFILAAFVFSYFPLFGWRYSFFDYKAGFHLLDCNFVGFKHFIQPFSNPILRKDILRVMRNTMAMSLINIGTSFLPMFFAIFLSEMRSNFNRRFIQTVTTVPNFISWILVYALAFSMFSIDAGFINRLLIQFGFVNQGINFLASPNNIWIKMWLYGTWKSLGWSAILYVAAINSIDIEIIEASNVDGANRFQKMFYITIPHLIPTFFVLLLLSIANFLNNGFEQFYVFQNSMNKEHIEMLDLFVYNRGMVGNNISFSTAISMLKSVISIMLLFMANGMSKLIRGESVF